MQTIPEIIEVILEMLIELKHSESLSDKGQESVSEIANALELIEEMTE